jgi:Skp family chaperone for outer membrane proteins
VNSQVTKCFVGLVVATIALPGVAQQGDSGASGIVAVLDVAKIFTENATFDSKMKSIKSEADSLKAEIQGEQEKIRQDALKLQAYEAGSPDRNQLEAELEQRQAALRTRARQSEQDLLNREAAIYYDTYSEMQKVVAEIAQQYGISLVLRFDSAEIDKSNRPEVIKGVNRAVVYHHKLDLTNMVIKAMSGATANAGTPNNK